MWAFVTRLKHIDDFDFFLVQYPAHSVFRFCRKSLPACPSLFFGPPISKQVFEVVAHHLPPFLLFQDDPKGSLSPDSYQSSPLIVLSTICRNSLLDLVC